MKLAFLSPLGSSQLPARSPILDSAITAGAVTEIRDGWETIVRFGEPAIEAAACRETVGFADASDLGKLELQGDGVPQLPPGVASRIAAGWHCPVRRTRVLVLCAGARLSATRASFEQGDLTTCDLTSSLAAISIAGPRARETIARFCAIDVRAAALPVAGFRPGSICRTPGYLLREGPDRFRLLFGAGYGRYVWEVVSDAAVDLGGHPVAMAALPSLPAEVEADA